MTYIVSGGALNSILTHSLVTYLCAEINVSTVEELGVTVNI